MRSDRAKKLVISRAHGVFAVAPFEPPHGEVRSRNFLKVIDERIVHRHAFRYSSKHSSFSKICASHLKDPNGWQAQAALEQDFSSILRAFVPLAAFMRREGTIFLGLIGIDPSEFHKIYEAPLRQPLIRIMQRPRDAKVSDELTNPARPKE
jgi:hypothetical protein